MNTTLVITATGPSIDEISLEPLRDKVDFMCINKPATDKLIDHWVFIDGITADQFNLQFENNETVHIWSSQNCKRRQRYAPHTTLFIHKTSIKGFGVDFRKNTAFACGSSLYFGLQIADVLDYEHIYVFGCDQGSVNGKMWVDGRNNTASEESKTGSFLRERSSWEWLKANRKDILSKVTFCSDYLCDNNPTFSDGYTVISHKIAVNFILEELRRV